MIGWVTRVRTAPRAARWRDEDASVLVFTGLVFAVLLAVGAVAVDLGRLASTSRDQQGAADRVALDTLLHLQRTGPTGVADAARRSRDRNLGVWGAAAGDLDAALTVRPVACGPAPGELRAVAGDAWGDPDVSGVEVVLGSTVASRFLPGVTPFDVTRRAVACSQPLAAISAAGTTATLDEGLTGALLSGLTGGALDVSLIGWNGLAQVGVSLLDLGEELGRIGVDVGAGTLTELLDADVTAGQLAQATVAALVAGGDTAGLDATLLGSLAVLEVPALAAFRLGDLLEASTSAEAALLTEIDALGLVVAGLQLANHRAAAALDLEIPGVTGARLSVIEPPAIAIGPPGFHGDGTPRTRARGAQLGLDLRLPVGTVRDAGSGVDVSPTVAAQVQPFRTRIDAISTCSQALSQSSTAAGTVRSDLEAAIDDLEAIASAAGLLGVVGGLLDAVGAILGGLTGTLSCLLAPTSTRESIKADLRELADAYEQLLATLAGELVLGEAASGSAPALSVRLAQASHTLTAVTCADDAGAEGRVVGEAARALFTDWAGGFDPAPAAATIDLLDVDLGLLTAQVGVRLDTLVGSSVDEVVAFPGPHPTTHRQGSHVLGATTITDGLQLDVTGTSVLGVPLGAVVQDLVDGAVGELSVVLAELDALLAPTFDALGVQLGGVEAAVLSTRCSGRSLVR